MNKLCKDLVIEIMVKSEIKDVMMFSLTCKKYFGLIWENEIFWRNKVEKEFRIKDKSGNKNNFILLNRVKEDPQYWYSKSIYDKDEKISNLISRSFKVYFPYIGVVSPENPNFFGVFPIYNLIKFLYIPDYVLDLRDLGDLTINHHTKAMGLSYFPYMIREEVISNIYEKLNSLSLIFKIGDPVPYNFTSMENTKPIKIFL